MITDMLVSIKKHYPDLEVFNAKIYKYDRSNHVLLINKDYIFRFPKSEKGVLTLKKEARLLRKLDKSFKLNIPYPEYLNFADDNVGETFIGYRKLSGKPLSSEELKDDPNYRSNLEKILIFLRELHQYQTLSLDLSYFDDSFQNCWKRTYELIKEDKIDLKGKDKELLLSSFEEYFNLIEDESYEQTLIHGDFQIGNLLFDNGRICSVIDFEDSIIGDRAFDYATLLISLNEEGGLLKEFDNIIKGDESFYKRVEFYLLARPFI